MIEQTVIHEDGEELVIQTFPDPAHVARFMKEVSVQAKEDHLHAGNERRLDFVKSITQTAIESGYFRPETVRIDKSKKKKPAVKVAGKNVTE